MNLEPLYTPRILSNGIFHKFIKIIDTDEARYFFQSLTSFEDKMEVMVAFIAHNRLSLFKEFLEIFPEFDVKYQNHLLFKMAISNRVFEFIDFLLKLGSDATVDDNYALKYICTGID